MRKACLSRLGGLALTFLLLTAASPIIFGNFTRSVSAANGGHPGVYIKVENSTGGSNITFGPGPAVGQIFNVTIMLYNVTTANVPPGLQGVEVKLKWNTTLLQYVSHVKRVGTIGGALNSPTIETKNEANQTTGIYWLASASTNMSGWNGDGAVAQILFEVLYQPQEPQPKVSSTLEIIFGELIDFNLGYVNHEIENAYYEVLPRSALEYPSLAVEPAWVEADHVNQEFSVSVMIAGLLSDWDMGGYEFKLQFNKDALAALEVSEGAFLGGFGDTSAETHMDNTAGYAWINVTQLIDGRQVPSGGGVLATVKLKAVSHAPASSGLSISEGKLYVWQEPSEQVFYEKTDGFYQMMEIVDHTVAWEDESYVVRTQSNSSVSAEVTFNATTKSLVFYVTGADDTGGFCNVTVPKSLLKADPITAWIVKVVNRQLVHGTNLWTGANSTHTSLWFVYSHSTQKIQVIGTEAVVPPSNGDGEGGGFDWTWVIVAVVAVAVVAVVAVMLLKRRTKSEPQMPVKETRPAKS